MTASKIFIIALLFFSIYHFNSFGQKSKLISIFPLSSPEQQGINSATLDSMMLFIKNSNQNVHHLTIIRNNHTILDADIYPYESAYLHDLASVTKSITSLLIGIAIDKMFIKDENEIVIKFFPEISNHNKLLDSLKIKDLITMTSGFACGVSDGEKALNDMRKGKDWINYIFNLPMTSKPGDVFSYCSCNFYLLSEIIFRTTGLIPHEFAKKYLFSPLQITNSKWLTNYKKINHGWGDLFLVPADMAKIGKLMLDKGRWKKEQIVSEQWVNKSLHTNSNLPDNKGYGYGWWTNDKAGYYEAAGRGRQTISIIPSKNMIVTMLGGEFDAGTIGKYIFESIQSDKALSESKIGFEKLNKTVIKATMPSSRKLMARDESIINKLNRRTILFERNITEIDSLQFNFSSKSNGTVIFYRNKTDEKYPFVISADLYMISMDATLHLPVALQAVFNNEDEFILHYNQLCRINNFYFHFIIGKENIITRMEETSNLIKINIASRFK